MTFLEVLGAFYLGSMLYKGVKFISDEYKKYESDPENYEKANQPVTKTEEKHFDVTGKELTADQTPAKLEVYTDTKAELTYYILYSLDNVFISQGFSPEELITNALKRFPNKNYRVTESFKTER